MIHVSDFYQNYYYDNTKVTLSLNPNNNNNIS